MSVIYCYSFVNGHRYIGQTKNLDDRHKRHMRAVSRNSQLPVHRAFRKYGKIFPEILEETESLNDREKFWIATLNTVVPNGLNLTEGGEGGIPSAITKEKMRRSAQGNNSRATVIYEITHPSGEIVVVTNMAKFCRDYGHCRDKMMHVASGKFSQHHGLRVVRRSTNANCTD